jgi:hypothetical protein
MEGCRSQFPYVDCTDNPNLHIPKGERSARHRNVRWVYYHSSNLNLWDFRDTRQRENSSLFLSCIDNICYSVIGHGKTARMACPTFGWSKGYLFIDLRSPFHSRLAITLYPQERSVSSPATHAASKSRFASCL